MEGARLQGEGRGDEALAAFERARALFPEYAGGDAPTLLLGRLHAGRGDHAAAAEAFRAYAALNENHYEARIAWADAEAALGNVDGEREALAGAVWIDPFPSELHDRLAGAYEEAGEWGGAVVERGALVALEPADRAAAYYRLALAQHRHGDSADARRTVLRALEIAPNYDDALRLLVEIRGGGG
jgi:tetratricopeptide (TPR) repeat protein